MDVAIHYGTLRHLRDRVPVRRWVLVTAMSLDVVLSAFLRVKASTDAVGIAAAGAGVVIIIVGERLFMRSHTRPDGTMDM